MYANAIVAKIVILLEDINELVLHPSLLLH